MLSSLQNADALNPIPLDDQPEVSDFQGFLFIF